MPIASGNPTSGGAGQAAAPAGTAAAVPTAAVPSRREVQPAAAAAVPGSPGNPSEGQ
jgi:hypothetical protein